MNVAAVGIAWYRREDYHRILDVMADAHRLPPTYESWLKAAEQGIRQLEAAGHVTVKVQLDPDLFVTWCRQRDLNVDARARIAYASEAAARQALGVKGH